MAFISVFHSKMCFQQFFNNQQNIYLHTMVDLFTKHLPFSLMQKTQEAEIQGFLLRYSLFLYYYWFSQNMKNGWRKYFVFLVMKMNYRLPLCCIFQIFQIVQHRRSRNKACNGDYFLLSNPRVFWQSDD